MNALLAAYLLGLLTSAAVPVVARVDTDDQVVALTFDACATKRQANGFDRAVFDVLKREQIPVTIFLSGKWIEFHPAEARELAAEPWIEIGEHGHTHPKFTRIRNERIREEIDKAEAAIATLGRKSVALRPPFGDWNYRVARVAEQRGLPMVTWDVVSGDAGGHIRAEKVVANVTEKARAGSIIIFHINGRAKYAVVALPDVIKNLRDRGFRFVKISELLSWPGGHPVSAHPMHYVRPGHDDHQG